MESLLIQFTRFGGPDRLNVVTVRLSVLSTIATALVMAPMLWAITGSNKARSQRTARFIKEILDRAWQPAQGKVQEPGSEASPEV